MNYQDKQPVTVSSAADGAMGISPQRMRRAIMIAGVAIVLVVGLLVGFNVFRGQMMKSFFASNVPPPISVNFETIQASSVARSLTAVGSISAVHQVTISPEISGQVRRIAFIPGSAVKKGDVIAQLNDATEQADLANARAQQKLAGITLKRVQDLIAKGAVSQAQLDQAKSQFDAATATIARTEAVIAKKLIRAPFDGVLGVRQTEVGHYLEAGRPVVMITDMKNLFVELTLPEQARPQISLGQAVEMTVDAYPGKTFKAVIAVIDPQINMTTRTVLIQAVADNSDGQLMPGMFAKVAVMLPSATDKLTIPETALDYSLYGNSAYVIEDAGKDAKGQPSFKVKRTSLKTGASVDGRIVVESGLNPGERVVTTGLSKLFDGARVSLDATQTLVKPTTLPVP